MPFRPAVLSYDDLRRRAEAFLDDFHSERTLPVPIEEIVEFDFELEVVPIDGILDDLEVDAFLTSDLKRIYVDAFVLRHRRGRYRFSLAHELAHHELHRPLYEESRVTSVRDWRALQEAISEEDYAWFEFQANSFAGLVLVPPAELQQQFSEPSRRRGLPGSPTPRCGATRGKGTSRVGWPRSSRCRSRSLKDDWRRTASGRRRPCRMRSGSPSCVGAARSPSH